jgi:predicted SAM-dependent methyltransferase
MGQSENSAEIRRLDEKYYIVQGSKEFVEILPWLPEKERNSLDFLHLSFDLRALSSMEANTAFHNYFQALRVDGRLSFEVKDIRFFMRMWTEATWSEEHLTDTNSKCRKAFREIFGSQEYANPALEDYQPYKQSIFKSGYDHNRADFLLRRAGFSSIVIHEDGYGTLRVEAYKRVADGVRQVSNHLRNIRTDHVNRYAFATDRIARHGSRFILDCACGVGYGTKMLGEGTDSICYGIDIDPATIKFAMENFGGPKSQFVAGDAIDMPFSREYFDAIVSFETIEHVENPEELLLSLNQSLKRGGILICSTPNQSVLPFNSSKFPHHFKHYTLNDLCSLLSGSGFTVDSWYGQGKITKDKVAPSLSSDFIILVAFKEHG